MTKYRLNAQKLMVDNITEQTNILYKLLQPHVILEIDLSNIQHIDSAGVAFLLELKSIARKKSCSIKFTHTPNNIEHLCQLYNINL